MNTNALSHVCVVYNCSQKNKVNGGVHHCSALSTLLIILIIWCRETIDSRLESAGGGSFLLQPEWHVFRWQRLWGGSQYSWPNGLQDIHIWTNGEVGAPLHRFTPSSIIFLVTVWRRCFFWRYFLLFLSCFVMLSCTSVCRCLLVTCLERVDLLALVCDVKLWRCHFPIGILGQVWCLIVSIPDLCTPSYFI